MYQCFNFFPMKHLLTSLHQFFNPFPKKDSVVHVPMFQLLSNQKICLFPRIYFLTSFIPIKQVCSCTNVLTHFQPKCCLFSSFNFLSLFQKKKKQLPSFNKVFKFLLFFNQKSVNFPALIF